MPNSETNSPDRCVGYAGNDPPGCGTDYGECAYSEFPELVEVSLAGDCCVEGS